MSTGRRRFVQGLAAVGLGTLAGLSPRVAHAANVVVKAGLSATQTTTDKGVYLTVEVIEQQQGARAMISRPIIEVDDGTGVDPGTVRWDLTKTGSRSSFAFGTGVNKSEVTTTYTYLLMADRAGSYGIKVGVEANDARIDAPKQLRLDVATGALPPDASAGTDDVSAAGEPVPPTIEGRPKVFVRHVVDRDEAFVNQPIVYRYEIWQRVEASLEPVKLPTFKDFYVEELPVGGVGVRRIADGTRYRVHTLMHRVLYPQRAGEVEVGPGEVKATPQVAFGLFARPSSSPPFTVRGKPLTIDVKALPAEGQPAGFSANSVGSFRVKSSVDRNVVEVGDGLTWTVEISGEGNVRAVDPGNWPEVPGFRAYEPKESFEPAQAAERVGGRKTWVKLLVAQTPGEVEIPAFEFPFFDPERGAYDSVSAPAMTIEVQGTASEAETAEDVESRSEAVTGDDADLLADVFTPATLPRRDAPASRGLSRTVWRRLSVAAPATLAVGWAVAALVRRLGPDEASRERRQRATWAKARLGQARDAIEGGLGFHGAVAELLQAAAVRRAGDGGIGLPRDALASELAARGVPPTEIERWRALLDHCDAARFGAATGDAAARRRLYDEAVALIESRAWRSP